MRRKHVYVLIALFIAPILIAETGMVQLDRSTIKSSTNVSVMTEVEEGNRDSCNWTWDLQEDDIAWSSWWFGYYQRHTGTAVGKLTWESENCRRSGTADITVDATIACTGVIAVRRCQVRLRETLVRVAQEKLNEHINNG